MKIGSIVVSAQLRWSSHTFRIRPDPYNKGAYSSATVGMTF